MSTVSNRIAFNEYLDIEARMFSSCFIKSLDKAGSKIFSSKEVQETSQCTFNQL